MPTAVKIWEGLTSRPIGNFSFAHLPVARHTCLFCRYSFNIDQQLHAEEDAGIISASPPILLPGNIAVTVRVNHMKTSAAATSKFITSAEIEENTCHIIFPCFHKTTGRPPFLRDVPNWTRDVTLDDCESLADIWADDWDPVRLESEPIPNLTYATVSIQVNTVLSSEAKYLDGRILSPVTHDHTTILVTPENHMLVMVRDNKVDAWFEATAEVGRGANVDSPISLPADAPVPTGKLSIDVLRQARRGRPPAEDNRPSRVENESTCVEIIEERRLGHIELTSAMSHAFTSKRGLILASTRGVTIAWAYGQPTQIRASISVPSQTRSAEVVQTGRAARHAWADEIKAIPAREMPADLVKLDVHLPNVPSASSDLVIAQTDSYNMGLASLRSYIRQGWINQAQCGMLGLAGAVRGYEFSVAQPEDVAVEQPKRRRGRPRLTEEEKAWRKLLRGR
ncbi:hypothetical protein J8273_8642 [Carpediemonas membranifera]|uniref:Uncharacterized protein n=1 Tax=Carpediemonas membranifera TaxID=201153 RepID=A0A8J6ARZ0_9EUKA|nr:hypothetical protein J8273_8642 [Carpediemonas membranifera]|eukprot:KAG9389955.1 hypothetical protein J8273_8642 [Carpediemonas membranifera]